MTPNLEPSEVKAKKEIEDIKQLVSKLYLQLNVEHYEIQQEQKLLQQLELLKSEIQPMEKVIKLVRLIKNYIAKDNFLFISSLKKA